MRVVAQDLWRTLPNRCSKSSRHAAPAVGSSPTSPRRAGGGSGPACRLTALGAPGDAGVTAQSSLRRHVHVGAQRLPHGARRLAVGERLHDGAVAERAQHVVAGERPGIRRAELVVHQGPEVADPHHSSLPPATPEPFRAKPSSERYRNRPRMSGPAGIVLSSRATPRAHRLFRGAAHDRAHPWDQPARPSPLRPDEPAPQPARTAPDGGRRRPRPLPGGVALADDPQPPAAGGRKRTGLLVGGVATGARPRRRRRVRLPEAERRRLPARRRAARRRVRLPPPRHRPLGRPEDRRGALPRQAARRSRTRSAATTRARSSGSSPPRTPATTASRSSATTTTSRPGSATASVPPSARGHARSPERRRRDPGQGRGGGQGHA